MSRSSPPPPRPPRRLRHLPRHTAFAALLGLLAGCQPSAPGAAAAPAAGAASDMADTARAGGDPTSDTSVAEALRARDWPAARQLAAAGADPLAPEVVDWLRLQTPGAAGADEIADFLDTHAGWPLRSVLTARLSQALAVAHDPAVLRRLCTLDRLQATTPGLATLRNCATAVDAADPQFAALLRHAWVEGIGRPDDQAAFLAQWPTVVTPADDAARFDALLARGDLAAAAGMQDRVDAARRLRLRLRLDPAGALAASQALLAGQGAADDAGLLRDTARLLRRQGRLDDAMALWTGPGAALSDPASGTEREALARDLLGAGRPADAARMAQPGALAASPARDEALFLSGWIAWRQHDTAAARTDFTALAAADPGPLNQSRAHYWLARAAAGSDDALTQDRLASAYPTTFYGQLALARGLNGESAPAFDPFSAEGLRSAAASRFNAALAAALDALPQPRWSRDEALAFAARPFSRAATLLVAWEEAVPARSFLLRTALDDPDPKLRAMAASQALHMGLPETAVAIARLAGHEGTLLLDSGWPAPYRVGGDGQLPPGLVMGLIRQESSFDTLATSPAGARGLMQLMPATANQIARTDPQAGVTPPISVAILVDVPQVNIALGQTYLAKLLARFDGDLPPAIAAYNAGPHRIDLWSASPLPGPPPQGDVDAMVNWIEALPFDETRTYVRNVLGNAAVYRARQGARP